MNFISTNHLQRSAILKAMVFMMAYLTVTGWLLSIFWTLKWQWLFAIPGLFPAVWLARRQAKTFRQLWAGMTETLGWWPFWLLMSMMLVAGLMYPPTMLDSLTYRLPRLFEWMQNGHIKFILTAEDRMNYMPHTWGLCMLPVIQLTGDRLAWLGSWISWLAFCLMAYDWAYEVSGNQSRARQMALIAATSTFVILQAESSANDFFAATLIFCSLRFVLEFERTRRGWEISWAILSFCLAAGTKPQFAVFGLPLVIWFFASPGRPWRLLPWAWSPVLLAIWLVCSPVPSFVLNYKSYKTFAGPGQDYSMTGQGPIWNWTAGAAMIFWQSAQPPISPAGFLNNRVVELTEKSGITKYVPRFNMRVPVIAMVDSAPLGFVTSAMFAIGLYLAAKRRIVPWRSWRTLALAAGLLCLAIALAKIISENSGRAFCGFLYFALPLAMVGWETLSSGRLRLGFYLSLGSALIALILTPSRPLWPSQAIYHSLAARHPDSLPVKLLEPYVKYSERANTAREIIDAIPLEEQHFAVLAGGDRPLLPLFRPYDAGRDVHFLPRHASAADLNRLGVNYVVVGGGAEELYPELCAYLQQNGEFREVASKNYTSKIQRGPEPWRLYQRVTATNQPIPPP